MRIRGTVTKWAVSQSLCGSCPESPEVDLEQLKTALKQKLPGIQDMKVEPIGFGLKAIKFAAIINDAGGETDALEKSLSSIPGVERAEIIEVTLN